MQRPHEDPPFIVTLLVGAIVLFFFAMLFGGCEKLLFLR